MLTKVKNRLSAGDCTLVVQTVEQELVFTQRGVAPLLQCLEDKIDLSGALVADKVVGKGAAFLYVLLGVKAVYGEVVSEKALSLLKKHNIRIEYALLVPAIRNRAKTGFCPVESAVWEMEDPVIAYHTVQKTLQQLQGK